MNRLLRCLALGLTAVLPVIPCAGEEVTPTDLKGDYAVNGRLHVSLFGTPDNDESAVVYRGSRTGKNQLYMYRLKDGSTVRVSTNADANYMFPCGEATPK